MVTYAELQKHLIQTQPENCKCDVREWIGEFRPICNEFEGEPGFPCTNCEHDEECHESLPRAA